MHACAWCRRTRESTRDPPNEGPIHRPARKYGISGVGGDKHVVELTSVSRHPRLTMAS